MVFEQLSFFLAQLRLMNKTERILLIELNVSPSCSSSPTALHVFHLSLLNTRLNVFQFLSLNQKSNEQKARKYNCNPT